MIASRMEPCQTLTEIFQTHGQLPTWDALKLGGTAISDVTLAALGSFPHIRVLDLTYTKISDASIPTFLKQKDHLRQLFLSETAITDKAIKKFSELGLNILRVEKCPGVTPAALSVFRQQHPHCEVSDDAHPYLSKKDREKLEDDQ